MNNIQIEHYSEFIYNPSPLSMRLVEIVASLTDEYNEKIQSKNMFIKGRLITDIEYYKKIGHKEYVDELQKKGTNYENHSIAKLLDIFKNDYKKIIFNNIVLASCLQHSSCEFSLPFTYEDYKNKFLFDLSHRVISEDTFKRMFGHYALNAFELQEKRFREYSSKELLQLANLVKKQPSFHKKKPDVVSPHTSKEETVIQNLLILRECAKYHVLFIIDQMRNNICAIAQKNNIKNPFICSMDVFLKEE